MDNGTSVVGLYQTGNTTMSLQNVTLLTTQDVKTTNHNSIDTELTTLENQLAST